ncbi:Uncharacterised protein [Vibrio cholerae]|nr:Uncharacterised protein [Vibrio cholerae]
MHAPLQPLEITGMNALTRHASQKALGWWYHYLCYRYGLQSLSWYLGIRPEYARHRVKFYGYSYPVGKSCW